MAEIVLRPYQERGITEIRASFALPERPRGVLFCLPTGGGKTLTAAYVLLKAMEKGNVSFFCVNRIELVEQTAKALSNMGITFGYICAGMQYLPGRQVYICMVQTLARRLSVVPTPDFIVWDECRGIAAKSVAAIYAHFTRAKHLGLDATPIRSDGRALAEWFQVLVMGPSYRELQAFGALVPFRVLAASKVSTAGLHTVGGDYDKTEVDERMNKREIIGDGIECFKALGAGHRCLTFAANIGHSENIASAYREAGIPWAHVDGNTPDGDRRDALRAIRSGAITGISSVDLFLAGLDVTEIDVIQWERITKSVAIFLQGSGRGSRPHQGKQFCTLLDHAANVGEIIRGKFVPNHGLPDQDREWSLDGRKKGGKAKDKLISLKQCKVCGGTVPSTNRICGAPTLAGRCEYAFTSVTKAPAQVDGELIELTPEQAAVVKQEKRDEVADADTMDKLIALGAKRGYKSPFWWAKSIMDNRRKRA